MLWPQNGRSTHRHPKAIPSSQGVQGANRVEAAFTLLCNPLECSPIFPTEQQSRPPPPPQRPGCLVHPPERKLVRLGGGGGLRTWWLSKRAFHEVPISAPSLLPPHPQRFTAMSFLRLGGLSAVWSICVPDPPAKACARLPIFCAQICYVPLFVHLLSELPNSVISSPALGGLFLVKISHLSF